MSALRDQDLELVRLGDLSGLPEDQGRVVTGARPRPAPEQGPQTEAARGLGAVQRRRARLHYHKG